MYMAVRDALGENLNAYFEIHPAFWYARQLSGSSAIQLRL